jgi:uncharacterized caspase-like protein
LGCYVIPSFAKNPLFTSSRQVGDKQSDQRLPVVEGNHNSTEVGYTQQVHSLVLWLEVDHSRRKQVYQRQECDLDKDSIAHPHLQASTFDVNVY